MARKVRYVEPDTSLLSEEQKAKLRAQARKEHEDQLRGKQERAFISAEKDRLDREAEPSEQLIRFTVELPNYCEKIVIDGTVYFHGTTYELPLRQFYVVREIVEGNWAHEMEVQGRSRDRGRTRNIGLRNGMEGVAASALMA